VDYWFVQLLNGSKHYIYYRSNWRFRTTTLTTAAREELMIQLPALSGIKDCYRTPTLRCKRENSLLNLTAEEKILDWQLLILTL
jgi:hypothetical protein